LRFICVNSGILCGNSDIDDLVYGAFSCGGNHLVNLKYSPTIVGKWFSCINNQLTTLKGVSRFIGQGFYCQGNSNLSPYEMRWILISTILGEILTGNEAADEIFAKYHGKKEMLGRAIGELKTL